MGRIEPKLLRIAHSRLGQLVDNKYRLLSVIGIGGMGIVYEAEHEFMKRKVALKLLRPSYADRQKEFQRFLREVRIVGTLTHRTIVRIFDAGFLDGTTPYLVMERLVGEDLQEKIYGLGHLSLRTAAWVGYEVLRGLDVAHRAGVVHCDLKPGNVFIHQTPDMSSPIVKLLDFGISTMIVHDSENQEAQHGRAAGTPYYMAPEQVRGHKVDPRTDLWAVGAILYESVTGRRPFVGNDKREVFDRIRHEQVVAPSRVAPISLPTDFEQLILALLSKDRQERPQSAKQVATALADMGLVDVQVWTSTHEGARPPRPQPYHTASFEPIDLDDD